MGIRQFFSTLLAMALVCGGLAAPAFAEDPPAGAASDDELVSINFDDADLREVVTAISRMTNINFLIDQSVKGSVTIVAPQQVPRSEVFQVFQSILKLNGYALVPGDNLYKVVPSRTAVQDVIPVRKGSTVPSGDADNDQLVTQIIPLRYAEANTVSTAINGLISRDANMVPYPSTNMLILTDTAGNIARVLGIVREIDQPGFEENITIRPITYATAEQLSQTIERALEPTGDAAGRRARRPGSSGDGAGTTVVGAINLIPDQRTNAIIIVANEIDTEQVLYLIEKLDTPTSIEQNNIHVVHLKHSLAPDLAEVLSSLAGAAPPAVDGDGGATGNRVRTFYREVSVVADESTNSLLIIATPADFAVVNSVIARLDVRRPQVLVEVLIAEVSLSFARNLGVRWSTLNSANGSHAVFSGVNQSNSATAGGSALASLSGVDLTDIAALSAGIPSALPGGFTIGAVETGDIINLYVEANAQETDSDFNILSAPHVLTLDNEEARIVVANNVPFVTSSLTDTGGSEGLAQNQTFEFRDVGITLEITPHIGPDRSVRLELHQEVNEVGEEVTVGSTTSLTEIKREVDTVILVNDRHTIVIGGLITETERESESKVPIVGDIPIIGRAFKNTARSRSKRNLLIFITPTIVSNLADSEWVTKTKTEESPDGVQRQVDEHTPAQRSQTFNPQAPASPSSQNGELNPAELQMHEATVK